MAFIMGGGPHTCMQRSLHEKPVSLAFPLTSSLTHARICWGCGAIVKSCKSAVRSAHQDQVLVGGRGQLLLDSVSSDVALAALPEPAGGLVDDIVHLHRVGFSWAAGADAGYTMNWRAAHLTAALAWQGAEVKWIPMVISYFVFTGMAEEQDTQQLKFDELGHGDASRP